MAKDISTDQLKKFQEELDAKANTAYVIYKEKQEKEFGAQDLGVVPRVMFGAVTSLPKSTTHRRRNVTN